MTPEELVRELLEDPPKSECAENGVQCPFCWARYEYPYNSNPIVNHDKSCWLTRAAEALETSA